MSKKPHKTAVFIFHTINIHVPIANMTQKCPTYQIYANYFTCSYGTIMSVYIPLTTPIQSTMSPHTLVYMYFTLLACTLCKDTCHITYACCTALLLWSTRRLHIFKYISKTSKQVGFELKGNMHMYYAFGNICKA